jgi:hypothetical protein
VILPEDLERPPAGEDECAACGLEFWSCVCRPDRPFRKPTKAELESAREARLVGPERNR